MAVNLDRFAQGLPDPKGVPPLEQCQACGGEIYPGEDVYVLDDGYILHADRDCLVKYVAPETKTIEQALGGR